MQATTTGMSAANGRKCADLGTCEPDHLLHDSQNQLGASGDGQFLEKAVQMRMNGVIGNMKALGNPAFRKIVKHALDNLQLSFCKAQRPRNLKPSLIAKNCRSLQFAL